MSGRQDELSPDCILLVRNRVSSHAVGRCCAIPAAIAIALFAVADAHASDASSTPTPLNSSVATTEDARSYTVEPQEQNTFAPFAQQCSSGHTVGAARTAWYSVQGTGGPIAITTSGSDFDTALFVYTGSPSGPVAACSDDTSDSTQAAVTFTSTAGTTYLIQVGRACNETGPPKCTDNPSAGLVSITASLAAPNRDLDGDGYVGSAFGGPDCNDGAAAINPGAHDVPHDGIDQDCDGKDDPYPALAVTATMAVDYVGQSTRVRGLRVQGAPIGARVVVTCTPKRRGCRFTRKSVLVRSAKPLQLGKYFKGTRLRKDARVDVLVTSPGQIGSLTRYSMRVRHFPRKTIYCVQPGQTSPRRSCA